MAATRIITADSIANPANTASVELADLGENLIVNGGFDHWQRGTTFTLGTGTQDRVTADRWRIKYNINPGNTTVSRVASTSVSFPNSNVSPYVMSLLVANADSSISINEHIHFQHTLSGSDLRKIANKVVTLQFWVRASIAGVYSVSFQNSAQDRSLVETFTVNSANTWEQKTVSVNIDTTSGTWLYGPGDVGLRLKVCLTSGTNFQTTAGTWQTGNYLTTSSQTQMALTLNSTFYIAQVSMATGAGRTEFRPAGGNFAEEQKLCQRYFEKTYSYDTQPGTALNDAGHAILIYEATGRFSSRQVFKVEKATVPTVLIYSTDTGFQNSVQTYAGAVIPTSSANISVSTSGWNRLDPASGTPTTGAAYILHWTADCEPV